MTAPAPQSPEWWLNRLYKALTDRCKEIEVFTCYYSGDHPLPWLAPQARDEFRRILKMTRANYMGLVCDATAERLQPIGFRVGDANEGDQDSQRIWQANNMDFFTDQAILEAVITGTSYLMVAPNPQDAKSPIITAEHPAQVISECVPGSSARIPAAQLKVFTDDWTGLLNATLFIGGYIFKYQSDKPQQGTSAPPNWVRREVRGEQWPATNPLGRPPLFEMQNNPRLLGGGVSEIADVLDIQDRINKTLADRLITQDYGAFPQKWALGWPDDDDKGNPQPKIDVGRNRMVTSSVSAKEASFGQWDAAPLDPYSAAKREDVKDIASRTRTPAQYLLGELTNVNGQTLKAAESGLVSKVRQRARGYELGLEGAMAAARQLAGLDNADVTSIEVIWRNPEYRTEGELVDALQKMATLHVPEQVLWERWGATPQEVERWQALNEANAADPAFAKVMQSIVAPPVERITVQDPVTTAQAPRPAQAPVTPPRNAGA